MTMGTDYSNGELFSAACTMYQTEASLSQHYETLRATLTAGNIAIVAAISGIDFASMEAPSIFLIALGIVAGLLSFRLSSAHNFHFRLAAKMRGIVAQHHPKTHEKLADVRGSWSKSYERWLPINHELLWVGINFFVPVTFALISYLSHLH